MKKQEVKRQWILIDADSKVLGRLSARISMILQGKHKPSYTPNHDNGDFVVVINAEKVRITGRKIKDKIYFHHSGYPGGLKKKPLKDVIGEAPEKIIKHAVSGMLPKNRLRKARQKRLKIYKGSEHNHSAQKPNLID